MKQRLPFRSWYYFRMGYGTYIAIVLGVVNVLTTTYYLAIKNMPSINSVIPDFATFIVIVVGIGLPLTVIIGYIHFKKSSGYSAEADIITEANPYYYKLPPGYWKDALVPAYLEIMKICMKLAQNEKISDEDLKRFKMLENKLDSLIKGESVK